MNAGNPANPCALVLATALAAVLALPAWAQPPLGTTQESGALVVNGLEPGAEVVGLVMTRFAPRFVPVNERRDETWVDEDRDGSVEIALPDPLPPKTVVIAVELASGRFDVWAPEGSPGREVALPPQALTPGPGGFELLDYPSPYLELLLVRPGQGSWGVTTGDGTATDESPASDGSVSLRPWSLAPIRLAAAAPGSFETGDLLFGISPVDMEYFAVRIVR